MAFWPAVAYSVCDYHFNQIQILGKVLISGKFHISTNISAKLPSGYAVVGSETLILPSLRQQRLRRMVESSQRLLLVTVPSLSKRPKGLSSRSTSLSR